MKKILMKNKIIMSLFFLLGLCITIYPIASQLYYKYESRSEVEKFNKDLEKISSEEINERIKLAEAYNRTLKPEKISDPYTDEEKKGVAEYARMLEVNERLGSIKIPKIDEELPIYAGSGEKVLQKGVGHLEETSLPIGGKGTHTVLTAHRGLPSAKLFTNLDKLEKGDKFYIKNISQSLAYEVDDISVVEPSDFSKIFIRGDEEYVTLLTCTPYALNTHRLLVRGHRVPNEQYIYPEKSIFFIDKIVIEYCLAILIIVVVYFSIRYLKKRKMLK